MHNPFIPVIQFDLGLVVVCGIALVLMSFKGHGAIHARIVSVVRHINTTEAVR